MTNPLTRLRPNARPKTASALQRVASNPDAFGEFYKLHAHALLRFVALRAGNPEAAADIVSESFAIAFEKRTDFRGTTINDEAAWLYTIAKSQMSRYWRAGKIEGEALARLGVDPICLTDPEIERIERLNEIAEIGPRATAALNRLPDDQRQAIQLRIIDELDYELVAAQVDATEQVARARVSRGLKHLSRRLRPQQGSTND